jgi:hypothetical protein
MALHPRKQASSLVRQRDSRTVLGQSTSQYGTLVVGHNSNTVGFVASNAWSIGGRFSTIQSP